MTVEAFVPSPVYVIAGTGPYEVTHAYRQGSLRLAVWQDGIRTELGTGDFTVSPADAEESGTVALSAAAAATHAGGSLFITRDTVPEQGWEGTTSRERGLEAQLDWTVQGVQDLASLWGRTIRFPLGDVAGRELPPAGTRASRWLGFDALGNLAVGYPADIGPLVTPFAETLLAASDRNIARSILGQGALPRTATFAAALAGEGAGAVGHLGGYAYLVEPTATGASSATSDLGVDGLVPHGPAYLQHFGGVLDGATDDAAACGRLVAWANARGNAHIIIDGPVRCTSPMAFTCKQLLLEFQPRGRAYIYFPDSNGISLVQASKYDTFETRNMVLITGASKTRTGWYYENTDAETGDMIPKVHWMPILIGKDRWDNGTVGAVPAGGIYDLAWLIGMQHENADRIIMYRPWIQGAEQDRVDGFTDAANYGLYFNNCTYAQVDHPNIFICHTGVVSRGQSEALEIYQGSIVACKRGCDVFSSTGPANDINISYVHMASQEYNISVGGGSAEQTMTDISNCLLFSRTEDVVDPNFKHIVWNAGGHIVNNYFFTDPTVDPLDGGVHMGVDIQGTAGTRGVHISGNTFNRIPRIAKIAAGVTRVSFTGNMTMDNSATLAEMPIENLSTATTVQCGYNFGDRAAAMAAAIDPGFHSTQLPLTTSAALADVANAINVSGKVAGKMVLDQTTSKVMIAGAASAAGTWLDVSGGGGSITPS